MSENMAWLDIETTGLEPERDEILEVGIVITTPDLEIVAEISQVVGYPSFVIRDALGDNEFVKEMHTKSGLLAEVEKEEQWLSDVEQLMVEFSRSQVPYKKVPLAGSTISFDRSFLRLHMPELNDYFHYRSIDVSSIRELAKLWFPELPEPPKSEAHRSLEDIHASIKLLKYYKENIFDPAALYKMRVDPGTSNTIL